MNSISLVTLIVAALVTCLCMVSYYHHRDKQKEKTKISFKEGLDLTELPIVTFKQGDKKLHFLLDTGSNISYIDSGVVKNLEVEDLKAISNTSGVGGASIETKHYNIKIGYKDQEFIEEFGALDLEPAFSSIEKEGGIKLHGILGSRFFEKYKYVLDFRELIAYR